MPRFFVSKNDIEAEIALIREGDAWHISRSLRMAVGDEIILSDGEGNDYRCALEDIKDSLCRCRIISSGKATCEPPFPITLFMAYPKGDKLETVIQKAVELGASKIIPFTSSRCVKRPDEKRSVTRLDRLCKIAEEAAKQCGRAVLPKVLMPISFQEMLAEAKKHSLALFCYEGNGTRSLKETLEEVNEIPGSLCAIVGSEGGFSREEAEEALAAGLTAVNLGPRILRCETAPAYVLTAVSYKFEL